MHTQARLHDRALTGTGHDSLDAWDADACDYVVAPLPEVRDFDVLVRVIQNVATSGTRAGIDGYLPSQLGKSREEWTQSAAAFAAQWTEGRLSPKPCVGPIDEPVPAVSDRIAGSYILATELPGVERALPPDVRGHRPGGRALDVLADVRLLVSGMPDATLVVGDLDGCFESVPRERALDVLRGHDIAQWALHWIERFYDTQGSRFPGIIRGIPWAALVVSAYLRPFDDLAAAASRWSSRYGDDFVLAFDSDTGARAFLDDARYMLGNLGLHLHEDGGKAVYVGPVTGDFRLLGIDFEAGVAHPPQKKLDELLDALEAADERGADLRPILAGRAGYWSAAAGSPRIEEVTAQIRARHAGLPRLDRMVETAALRAEDRRQKRRDKARARPRLPEPQPSKPQPPSPPGEHQVGDDPSAAPPVVTGVHCTGPEPAGRCTPSARPRMAVVEDGLLDLDLFIENVPRLHPGELWRAMSRDGWGFVTHAEKLAEVRSLRLYRSLGFRTWTAFCELHLAEDPAFVDRVTLVGLAALDAFATRGEDIGFSFRSRFHTDETVEQEFPTLPIGLLRALSAVRTEKEYWKSLTAKTLSLVASGRVSARQAKLGVKRSTWAAIRQTGRGRPKNTRVRWYMRTRSGTRIDQQLLE